jgi:hypothetical protein
MSNLRGCRSGWGGVGGTPTTAALWNSPKEFIYTYIYIYTHTHTHTSSCEWNGCQLEKEVKTLVIPCIRKCNKSMESQ